MIAIIYRLNLIAGGQEIGGSNPLVPTKKQGDTFFTYPLV